MEYWALWRILGRVSSQNTIENYVEETWKTRVTYAHDAEYVVGWFNSIFDTNTVTLKIRSTKTVKIRVATVILNMFWFGVMLIIVSSPILWLYSNISAHRNWQIETAVWNLAGFLHCALETRWKRFGQFLNDFPNDFLHENLNCLYAYL